MGCLRSSLRSEKFQIAQIMSQGRKGQGKSREGVPEPMIARHELALHAFSDGDIETIVEPDSERRREHNCSGNEDAGRLKIRRCGHDVGPEEAGLSDKNPHLTLCPCQRVTDLKLENVWGTQVVHCSAEFVPQL